jgi:hypothetical protein
MDPAIIITTPHPAAHVDGHWHVMQLSVASVLGSLAHGFSLILDRGVRVAIG